MDELTKCSETEIGEILQKSDHDSVSERKDNQLQDAFSIVFDAINSASGGIVIVDLQGTIQYVNRAFLRMFGYEKETTVIGKNAAELFATSEVRDFSDVQHIIYMTEGKTEEFTVQRQDGSSFMVEVASSNVTNHDDQIIGRMGSFVDISLRKEIEQDREILIQKLKEALEKIKTLRGIIPICAACKNIRDDNGFWRQVESYVKDHSDAEFTHSICPDCAKKLYPNLKYKE